jgi:MFS family permease
MAINGGYPNGASFDETHGVNTRRAVGAACFGFFVDMFDVYLPITTLVPALVYFTPTGLSSTSQATIFYLIFSATLIGRPIGALIFGYFGDSLGRRRTILISVACLSIVGLMIAALQGNAAWGGFSIAALIALRLINGIFVGGEYTTANPLAMEYSPKDKRGLYGALIHIGYPIALVCTALLTTLMLRVAPAGDASSAYAMWGWRVPFLIGSFLSGTLFFYYYWLVPESELWRAATKSTAPLKELFHGANLRRLGQLCVVMTGAWLTLNATIGTLSGMIHTVLGVKSAGVTIGILLGSAIAAVLYPFMGQLSQKFGRRTIISAIGFLNAVPVSLGYYALISLGYRDPFMLVFLVAFIMVPSLAIWAVHTPYLAESFHTSIRSCGYGVSLSLPAIIPGFYSLFMLGLSKLIPYEYTPIVLLALGGILVSLGALCGIETKEFDFQRQDG